jgi:hypothetical protein
LSNGKHVRFEVTNYFYWGTFEIELTDKEKEEILKKDSIILNDYSVSCPELDSGCDQYEDIENEESYTEEELLEINSLIYRPIDDEDYDSDKEDSLDTSVLEQNGWSMDDTIYGMDTGCELELISGEGDDEPEPESADAPAVENKNKDVDLFLVEGLQGTSDEGWCFRFTKEFENEDDAYVYYENIKLIPNKDIDRYEEQNNGVIGVQQKQIRNVNAKKIGNGIYEYDNDSSPIMTPECVTEDEEEDEEEEKEEDDEEEFTCQDCSTVQGLNNCERCDKENICEECYGEGGDYGPGEIWVCHECLPTCLECEAPLYTTYDECCGKGRSDEEEETVETEPTISPSVAENDVDALAVESVTEQTEPMVDDAKMVNCEGCEKNVLQGNSWPFVEDRFLCKACIDMNIEDKILYNCCNICDKFYHAAVEDIYEYECDYEDIYDGDVCYLCLPEIILN